MKTKPSLVILAVASFAMACEKNVAPPENRMSRLEGDVALDMHYTMTKTSFQAIGNKHDDIEPRTIPAVTKEDIQLRLFHGGGSELMMENLDHEVKLFTTVEEPAPDQRNEPRYFQIKNGLYSVYDSDKNLVFERNSPEMNFDGLLDYLKDNRSELSTLPQRLTGGVVFTKPKQGSQNVGLRTQSSPLHNAYDENPEFTVIRDQYVDHTNGLTYTQETIIKNSNQTLVWISLYDASLSLVSRTAYRYGGTDESPMLISTIDHHYETTPDGIVKQVVITEYENFEVQINF